MTNEVEVIEADTSTPEETRAAVQAAYDKVANPNKEEAKVDVTEISPNQKPEPTEETPLATSDEFRILKEQVARIPDLEKRLRDDGGRYGVLKQNLEELQKKLSIQATPAQAATNAVDVEDLLKDLKEAFGEDELYKSMKGAFSKVLASKGSVDPDSISKMVADRIAADKEAGTQESLKFLVGDDETPGRHPDFFKVRETPEFAAWKETLSASARTRLSRTFDADYVADKLDEFKEWDKAAKLKAQEPVNKVSHQKTQSSARLSAAVLPTSGTKATPRGEPSARDQVRAAYDKVAGKRI